MWPLSIIILTRDRIAKLEKCLARLHPQVGEADEILVIDTGSKDGTPERIAKSNYPRVRLERFRKAGSWAEARNFGVEASKNTLIAFIDDDCYAAPDWVERGRAAMQGVDAMGGLVTHFGSPRWPDWWIPEMGWLVGISVPGHLGPDTGSFYYPATANLWTRAAVIKTERFQEIGGELTVPENLRYAAGREDAEWWRRIRLLGYRTKFDTGVRVEHDFDPARLDRNYLLERARRDGEAWAIREGRAEDLEEIAYQFWLCAAPNEDDAARAAPNQIGRHEYLRLMKIRHGAALRGLSAKLARENRLQRSASGIRVRALLDASGRLIVDRGKTIARRIALASSPPRVLPLPSSPPSRVAVAALGRLGDLVLLRSTIEGVLEANPALRISVVAPPAASEILADVARLDLEVIDSPSTSGPSAHRFFRDWLGAVRPEVILGAYLHGDWGRALVRMRDRVSPLVGFENDDCLKRQIDRERIPTRVRSEHGEHETHRLNRLFSAVGLRGNPRPVRINPGSAAQEKLKAWRETLNLGVRSLPLLMLNPDAGDPGREWPESHWADLITKTVRVVPHVIVVNASRPRPELEASLELGPGDRHRIEFLRGWSLTDLIAILSACEGLITSDSGPMHLAHALDVPSLALFGRSDERRWADAFGRPIHITVRRSAADLTADETRGLPLNYAVAQISPADAIEKFNAWKKNLRSI